MRPEALKKPNKTKRNPPLKKGWIFCFSKKELKEKGYLAFILIITKLLRKVNLRRF
jgi:hypothetical protein